MSQLNILIGGDLSALVENEDQTMEFRLTPINPETQRAFANEAEVEAFARKMAQNPYVFIPKTPPAYKPLTLVEFVALVRAAGSMDATVALQVLEGTHADAEVRFLSAMLKMAGTEIHKDHQIIQDGLATLEAKTLITSKNDVNNAWPTE